jgi:ABC-type multidrug transport system ATPase subunit
MQTSGKVLFGGRTLSRQVKRNIGYVMQDDILFDALTVEETLLYAARLRMSRNMPLCAPQPATFARSI